MNESKEKSHFIEKVNSDEKRLLKACSSEKKKKRKKKKLEGH